MRNHQSLNISKRNEYPLKNLPSFRYPRLLLKNKPQQITASHKNSLIFHIDLAPLDILVEQSNSVITRCSVNSKQISISINGATFKKYGLEACMGADWVLVVFQDCMKVKVRKIGDENVFCRGQIHFDSEVIDDKDVFVVDLGDLKYEKDSRMATKKDKSSQMKQFIVNMMSKRINKKSTIPDEPINIRKNSLPLRQRRIDCNTQSKPISHKTHILKRISLDDNQQSYSRYLDHGKENDDQKEDKENQSRRDMMRHRHASTILEQKTLNLQTKRKNKFDNQPYYYQKTCLLEELGCQNAEEPELGKKRDSLCANVMDYLKQKTVCQSQNQESSVQESIHCSKMTYEQEQIHEKIGSEQSSSLCQSQQIESSGTIYESHYF